MHSIEERNEMLNKRKQNNFRNVISENFHEYCENTTIHGVRYVGKGSAFKRIAWLVICVSLLLFCGSQIYEIILKWRQSPLVFTLDKRYSPIEEVKKCLENLDHSDQTQI